MTLHKVTTLADNADFRLAFSQRVTKNEDKVCQTCGLQVTGHAPESRWLGYEPHPWQPIAADTVMVKRAKGLTVKAYSMRGTPCGHNFASQNCKTSCVHIAGHCAQCDN